MCGIVAYYSVRHALAQAELDVMTDCLSHRGPDDRGTWLSAEGLVGMGHRRLSILDTSSAGRQPMSHGNGRYWITYNGEIYNFLELRDELQGLGHSFRTNCDTEVLLAAFAQWGRDCLRRLRGMFAFVLWDRQEHRLFAARDRLGIKPLYYYWDGINAIFASEPKAILPNRLVEREVCPEALRDYLVYGFVPEPRSIYKKIYKLPPANWLELRGERLQTGCYWDLSFAEDPLGEAQWLDRLNSCLDDAVGSHLISDVPVGAFLSGGIDSSAVAASLARLKAGETSLFCVGFSERDFDESPKARRVADHLGLGLEEIRVESGTLEQDLSLLADIQDEPFGDYSSLPTMHLCRVTAQKVKVALSGDGGDENFAGYSGYRHAWQRMRGFGLRADGEISFARKLTPFELRGPLWWSPWSGLLSRAMSLLPAINRYLVKRNQAAIGPVEYYLRRNGHWQPEEAARLLRGKSTEHPYWAHLRSWQDSLDPVSQTLNLGLKVVLPGRMLYKVDRLSMAHGLEVRVPLLDHRLVELAASIPVSLKMKDGKSKYLFKKSLAASLPAEILEQRKAPFNPPVKHWLAEPAKLQQAADSILGNGFMAEHFHVPALRKFLDVCPQPKYTRKLYNLVMLDLWSRRWLVAGAGALCGKPAAGESRNTCQKLGTQYTHSIKSNS